VQNVEEGDEEVNLAVGLITGVAHILIALETEEAIVNVTRVMVHLNVIGFRGNQETIPPEVDDLNQVVVKILLRDAKPERGGEATIQEVFRKQGRLGGDHLNHHILQVAIVVSILIGVPRSLQRVVKLE
jgi:hypothetical protein